MKTTLRSSGLISPDEMEVTGHTKMREPLEQRPSSANPLFTLWVFSTLSLIEESLQFLIHELRAVKLSISDEANFARFL